MPWVVRPVESPIIESGLMSICVMRRQAATWKNSISLCVIVIFIEVSLALDIDADQIKFCSRCLAVRHDRSGQIVAIFFIQGPQHRTDDRFVARIDHVGVWRSALNL